MAMSRAHEHPKGGRSWCCMPPHGFVGTPIVTKCSPNNGPTVPGGCRRSPRNCDFQPTHAGLKTAKSSLVGPHKGGRSGTRIQDPPLVRGSVQKKKVALGLGLDRCTVPAIGLPYMVQISPKQHFQSPISTTRRARFVLCGSPWVGMHSHCNQMTTGSPKPPKTPPRQK